MRLKVFFGRR